MKILFELDFKNESNSKENVHNIWWYETFSIISVCTSCISVGTFLAYTSPALLSLQNDATFTLSNVDVMLIGSLGPVGALLGSILAIFPLKHVGPRRTIALVGLPPLFASWLIIGLSKSCVQLFFGRFVGGIGVGATIASAPLYVIDISSNAKRGKMGIMPQFLMISGILISNVMGAFLDWSQLALALALFPTLSTILTLLAPDPPKWLISIGKTEKALATFEKLYGKESASMILDILSSLPSSTNIFTPQDLVDRCVVEKRSSGSTVLPILTCLGLISIQQFTGINGVTFFTTTIFNQSSYHPNSGSGSRIQEVSTQCQSIILAGTQLVASFTSTFFIERCGRKFLLKCSTLTLTLSSCSLGIYFYWKDSLFPNQFWTPLVLLIIFVFGFAIGLGPVSWIFIAEILPPHIRHLINPLIIGYNWLCITVVTASFPWLKDNVDYFGIFWIYGGVAFVGLIFVGWCIPETKQKSWDEIQTFFRPKEKEPKSQSVTKISL